MQKTNRRLIVRSPPVCVLTLTTDEQEGDREGGADAIHTRAYSRARVPVRTRPAYPLRLYPSPSPSLCNALPVSLFFHSPSPSPSPSPSSSFSSSSSLPPPRLLQPSVSSPLLLFRGNEILSGELSRLDRYRIEFYRSSETTIASRLEPKLSSLPRKTRLSITAE